MVISIGNQHLLDPKSVENVKVSYFLIRIFYLSHANKGPLDKDYLMFVIFYLNIQWLYCLVTINENNAFGLLSSLVRPAGQTLSKSTPSQTGSSGKQIFGGSTVGILSQVVCPRWLNIGDKVFYAFFFSTTTGATTNPIGNYRLGYSFFNYKSYDFFKSFIHWG